MGKFKWFIVTTTILFAILWEARLGLLTGLLLAAVFSDVATRKIPNNLTMFGIVSGFFVQYFLPDGNGIVFAIKGLIFGFGLFLPFYILRVMGAGDVKLIAMVGCFVGSPDIFGVILSTLLAGGVLSLVCMIKAKSVRQVLNNMKYMVVFGDIGAAGNAKLSNELSEGKSAGGMPYAIAIAMGTVAYLLWQKFA